MVELDWTEKQRQKRAVAEYLAALEAGLAVVVVIPFFGLTSSDRLRVDSLASAIALANQSNGRTRRAVC